MNISVGYFHSSLRLLEAAKSGGYIYKPQSNYDEKFYLCALNDILNLSIKCNWIKIIVRDQFELSERGLEILAKSTYEERMQEQLRDFVLAHRPTWCRALYTGRHEFCRYAPTNVVECFKIANLLVPDPDSAIVQWWDELSSIFRNINDTELLETGRCGERLTVEYEKKRTGTKPTWQSIESNFSGYDVLSVVSSDNRTPLQIEVKSTSQQISTAKIIITKNEWLHAETALAFKFYLWSLTNCKMLAILDIDEIAPHIPENKGIGKWSLVEIPMKVFDKCFASQSELLSHLPGSSLSNILF